MKKTLQRDHVEANRSAGTAAIIAAVLFFAIGIFLSFQENPSKQLDAWQIFALGVLGLLSIMCSIYSLYLAITSIGTGGFPSPGAKLPARVRISYGWTAVVYRSVMIFSAVFLMAFSFMVVRYAALF